MVKILIGQKYCVRYLTQKDYEIFLAGQAVLQMSQISRSCVIASMSYKRYFEDPAQCVHTSRGV